MTMHAKIAATTATLAQLKPGAEYPGGNINARLHYTDAQIEELAASLKGPDGQLRPLLVATHAKKPDMFFVFGGGRRRLAFERLIAAGDLPKDHPIEINSHGEITVEQALSRSYADNQAEPMHPADQAVTFARLAADRAPEEIAKARGMTLKAVKQSIALGTALAPEVIAAWRAGKLTREQVEVFTIASDFESQVKTLNTGLANGYLLKVTYLRRDLMKNKEPEMKRLLGFVGVAAYRAAGGEVAEDFFGEGGNVKDMKLLKKLAKDKMAGIATGLEAKGWNWVETRMAPNFMHHGYGHIKAKVDYTKSEATRLDAIKSELKASKKKSYYDRDHADEAKLEREQHQIELAADFRAFTDQQRAKSGVIVTVGDAGTVTYEGGLTRKAEPKKAKTKPGGNKAEQDEPEEPKVPDVNDEAEHALEVLRDETLADLIAAKPKDAFALFLAAAIHHGWQDPVNLENLNEAHEGVIDGKSFTADFGALRKLSIEKLAAKLAMMVGRVTHLGGYISGNKDAAAIVDMVGEKQLQAALTKGFDAAAYLAGASQQHLLGVVAEAMGEAERDEVADWPAGSLVDHVMPAVKKTGWLPVGLRTRLYAGPSTKASNKPKSKVAAKKKAR